MDQAAFNRHYISSTQICSALNITRSGLTLAKKRKNFPPGIPINDGKLFLWERTPEFLDFLIRWQEELELRRSNYE